MWRIGPQKPTLAEKQVATLRLAMSAETVLFYVTWACRQRQYVGSFAHGARRSSLRWRSYN
jgi:hypothetical protein